jgi:hypothetical protein
MQLSLLTDLPELEKKVFLDVYAKVYFDTRRNRPRLRTIDGQNVPSEMSISCPTKLLKDPEGTIYKLDARLISRNGRQPYFTAINRSNVQKALEFFEYNLQIQKGIKPDRSKKKVIFEKKKMA